MGGWRGVSSSLLAVGRPACKTSPLLQHVLSFNPGLVTYGGISGQAGGVGTSENVTLYSNIIALG